ncbi:MAG: protein kinase [Acidobacteria bacterium]|nr:protein kinase [Acidobacteriota bacterium]
MNTCPQCGSTFSDDKKFCNRDGQRLVALVPTLAAPAPAPVSLNKQEAATLVDSPQAADPMIGKVLAGRYRILSLIGKGGMGAVYRGEHLKLGRPSAIKVILPASAQDETTLTRFQREAETSSKINHPNAVSIFDYGETEDGMVFLAMELIEGQQLKSILKREAPFSLERTLHIARQVGQALGAAHALNVVHRDLKPENIMLGPGDTVKVVDFGIAKSLLVDPKHQSVTRTGFIVGTPQYMSPEQVMGESLDPRSDVYSLGLVIYEMLTGALPFEGESAQAQMVNRLANPPQPMSRVRPGLNIPAAVEAAVMRALHYEREYRYPRVTDFIATLEHSIHMETQNIGQRKTDPAGLEATRPVVSFQANMAGGQPGYVSPPPVAPPGSPSGGYSSSPNRTLPDTEQYPPPVLAQGIQAGMGGYQPPPQGHPGMGGYVPPGAGYGQLPQPGPEYSTPPHSIPPYAPGGAAMTQRKKSSKTLIWVSVGVLVIVLTIGGGGIAIYQYNEYVKEQKRIAVEKERLRVEAETARKIKDSIDQSRKLREQGKFEDALKEMDAVLKLKSDSSAALIEKAESLFAQSKRVECKEIVDRVIKQDPDFAPAHQFLGLFYFQDGKKDKALEEQKKTLQLDPDPEYASLAHDMLAFLYWEQYLNDKTTNVGKLQDAETEALAAADVAPRPSLEISPRKTLIKVYYERRNNDQVRDQANKLITNSKAKNRDQAYGHNYLGLLHFNAGNYSQAANEFSTAATLDPEEKLYRDNLETARNKEAETFFPGWNNSGSGY